MANKQLTLPGSIVKKSNAIARAIWKPLSIWEARIVAHVAAKVKVTDKDFETYTIPLAEIGAQLEEKGGTQYKDIVRGIDNLFKADIKIRDESKPKNFRQYSIFSMCGYEDGCIVARFDPDLKQHFLNLQNNFTAYSLFEYLSLPSIYSQKLYELLVSWSSIPHYDMTLQMLHEFLSVPASFKDYRNFRRRVLDKAFDDIHDKTDLVYEWEPIKKGCEVVAIRFTFDKKRILAAREAAKEAKQKRLSKERNKYFQIASDCAKEKVRSEGSCTKQNNKKKACTMCQELDFVASYMKKKAKGETL